MAAKHTPGPWKTTTACGLTRINVANDQENRIVCSVPVAIPSRDTNATFGQTYPDAEGKANARLIVAAPDLLAELRNMVVWCGHRGETLGDDMLLPIERQPPEVQSAMRVIAKATGEQA